MDILQFSNFAELKKEFIQGKISATNTYLKVDNIVYQYYNSPERSFKDLLSGEKSGIIIFSLNKQEDNIKRFEEVRKDDLYDRIILYWKVKDDAIVPIKAISIHSKRVLVNEKKQVLSRMVEVEIPFAPEPIQAKVDTGADMCSLHGMNIKVDESNSTVSFTFSGKRFKMNMSEIANIKTSDNGGESRPVIKINMKVDGKPISDVKCNLNDRSEMAVEMLLGSNVLRKGDFLIDPIMEDIDWESFLEMDWTELGE